jgi:hypothetical protein
MEGAHISYKGKRNSLDQNHEPGNHSSFEMIAVERLREAPLVVLVKAVPLALVA